MERNGASDICSIVDRPVLTSSTGSRLRSKRCVSGGEQCSVEGRRLQQLANTRGVFDLPIVFLPAYQSCRVMKLITNVHLQHGRKSSMTVSLKTAPMTTDKEKETTVCLSVSVLGTFCKATEFRGSVKFHHRFQEAIEYLVGRWPQPDAIVRVKCTDRISLVEGSHQAFSARRCSPA